MGTAHHNSPPTLRKLQNALGHLRCPRNTLVAGGKPQHAESGNAVAGGGLAENHHPAYFVSQIKDLQKGGPFGATN